MNRPSLVRLLSISLLLGSACGALNPPPTPTSPPTETPAPTLPPTDTPTLAPTETLLPTSTPTETLTPVPTLTLTPVPTATNPPQPSVFFTYDNFTLVGQTNNVPDIVAGQALAYLNINNRDNVGDVRTPQPGNNLETLFYVSPGRGAASPILQMTAGTGDQVFISPNGLGVAYLRQENNANVDGLYVVDLSLTNPGPAQGRILAIDSLVQRGIVNEPSWSPDGTRLAIAIATGYEMEIYTVGRDGSTPINLTQSGAYDFYPAWSPDGRYIAFVSDRAICPTWLPGEPDTCDAPGATTPTGGYVYIVDFSSREVRQIGEQWVTEPPRWINARTLAYASGDPLFGDPERALFVADIVSGQTQEVQLSANDDAIKLVEAWSPNGQQVLYQAAGASTELVLATVDGQTVARTGELNFTRYGLSADWSPDGQRIAIGGINGQCPYGIIVTDALLDFQARGNPPPSMCEPQFSPDGNQLAFTGVNPRIDGRVDVYISNANGFGSTNLTVNLRGQILLLGWVGGG